MPPLSGGADTARGHESAPVKHGRGDDGKEQRERELDSLDEVKRHRGAEDRNGAVDRRKLARVPRDLRGTLVSSRIVVGPDQPGRGCRRITCSLTSSAGSGRAKRKPWPTSHPSSCSAARCCG